MKKQKKTKNEVKETDAAYNKTPGKNEIVFFNSFEEMNEYDHRQYALLTPEESLEQVTLMRLTRHPYLAVNLNPWGNKVYFD